MRIVWLISGLISLALGGLGVALPLLPTTPFVLLAALCFARSSPALHGWLLRNPAFGKAIRDWRANRAISRRGKTASVLAMALSLALYHGARHRKPCRRGGDGSRSRRGVTSVRTPRQINS